MIAALTNKELDLVSGGETGVTTEPDGTIVITASRMTQDQQLAYDMAYARAENEIWALGAVGAGSLGYLSTLGTAGAIGASVGGYTVGTTMDGETMDQLTNDLADSYYRADGADGTYDGVSDMDRASPYQ